MMTGWNYNDSKWGGFEVHKYLGQETGPNLVLIEGGSFLMGNVEQNVTYSWDNVPRKVTVSSFYMDETEVANLHYREYLYWLSRTFGTDFPEVYKRALPDTMVWRDELAYNEPYVEYYFRHPAYNYYPVVGVNWVQATEYCKWRSDRVNEMILIREGVLKKNPAQTNEENFNTEAYLIGKYDGAVKHNLRDYNPTGQGERKVTMEDGILLPTYRLPTEAEWEYAALSIVGNNPFPGEETYTDRKIYPWNDHSMRDPVHGSWQGAFLANYKRDKGDNMGIAGGLNDKADITAPVYSYMPNDYGLYNMAGNVSEWVMDVYRAYTPYDEEDFNPFRGSDFQNKKLDVDGIPVDKDSLGHVVYTRDSISNDPSLITRRNYKKGFSVDFLDADTLSEIEYQEMYGSPVTNWIDNRARVYKGGSWSDRAYFLAPGTRRFLDEEQSTATVGFRCSMPRVGGPQSNDKKGGNYFKTPLTKKNKKYTKKYY